MAEPQHSFAERFPEMKDAILELFQTNVAFQEICTKFGKVWDQLNELEQGDVAGHGGEPERLRKEASNLEYEMLNMLRDHMRT